MTINFELIRSMERAESLSHLDRLDRAFRPIAEALQGYPHSHNIRLSRLSDRVYSRVWQLDHSAVYHTIGGRTY